MGKNFKEKSIGKFKNKIYDYDDLDYTIKSKFNRSNWEIGESRKNKKTKFEKTLKNQFKKDYYDDEN